MIKIWHAYDRRHFDCGEGGLGTRLTFPVRYACISGRRMGEIEGNLREDENHKVYMAAFESNLADEKAPSKRLSPKENSLKDLHALPLLKPQEIQHPVQEPEEEEAKENGKGRPHQDKCDKVGTETYISPPSTPSATSAKECADGKTASKAAYYSKENN